MYRPSAQGSFRYEGADLSDYGGDYVTPTAQVLPPPPRQPFQTQDANYIHPITKRDEDFNEDLQRAMNSQGQELSRLRYHLSKMLKKQKKERCALLQYIYSLQDRESDQPNQKPNLWYAACIVIVLLVILIILVVVSLTKRKSNTDLQTLVALVNLLKRD